MSIREIVARHNRIAVLLAVLQSALWTRPVRATALEAVESNSGHHFAYGLDRDDAHPGLDFGVNIYGGDSVSFASPRGREALTRAVTRAVAAGEQRLSFDWCFDLRSVVERGPDGTPRLDAEALASVVAFLQEIDAGDALAQLQGRRFGADVAMFDYRIADGVAQENGLPIGEHPEYVVDPAKRAQLLAALSPALGLLASHPRVTLAAMVEPEFIALPASAAAARIRDGRWRRVALAPDLAGQVASSPGAPSAEIAEALGRASAPPFLRVRREPISGRFVLDRAALIPSQVYSFLAAVQAAVTAEAPDARVTVGWADDQSALENTAALEAQAGRVVTNVVSFHVYDPFHSLTKTRGDFIAVGYGDRTLRITEIGLRLDLCVPTLRAAILDALRRVRDSGLEGGIFWWDDTYPFAHEAYRQALQDFLGASAAEPAAEAPVLSIDDATVVEGSGRRRN